MPLYTILTILTVLTIFLEYSPGMRAIMFKNIIARIPGWYSGFCDEESPQGMYEWFCLTVNFTLF